MTATPHHSAMLRGVETERETLMGLDGRPLSLPELPTISKPPAKPAPTPVVFKDPVTLPPAAPAPLPAPAALTLPQVAPAPPVAPRMSTAVAVSDASRERESQERVHFNVVEGASPPDTALFDDPVGGAHGEGLPTLRPAAAPKHSWFRHPAVWFVVGSACTLLIVRLLAADSNARASTQQNAPATPSVVASSMNIPERKEAAAIAENPLEKPPTKAQPAAVAPTPGVAEEPASVADPAPETGAHAAAETREEETDIEATVAPPVVKAKRPRSRPKASKKKSFIPKGL